jgi:hypothetical protein
MRGAFRNDHPRRWIRRLCLRVCACSGRPACGARRARACGWRVCVLGVRSLESATAFGNTERAKCEDAGLPRDAQRSARLRGRSGMAHIDGRQPTAMPGCTNPARRYCAATRRSLHRVACASTIPNTKRRRSSSRPARPISYRSSTGSPRAGRFGRRATRPPAAYLTRRRRRAHEDETQRRDVERRLAHANAR